MKLRKFSKQIVLVEMDSENVSLLEKEKNATFLGDATDDDDVLKNM
jgi:hypothetical protein